MVKILIYQNFSWQQIKWSIPKLFQGATRGKFWGAYKNVENLTVYVSLFKYLYYNYTDKKQVTIAGCFRLAPFWVPSTSVHSAKWSSTRHTAQNVSQSKKKLQENHDDGKAKTHLQPFIQNSVQWYNQRSSSCLLKHARNVILFKPPWWPLTRMIHSISCPSNHLTTFIRATFVWILPILICCIKNSR